MRLPKSVVWMGLIAGYAIGTGMIWKEVIGSHVKPVRKDSHPGDNLGVVASK